MLVTLETWRVFQEDGVNFCSWSERPLCEHKARVKVKNLLPSRRRKNSKFQAEGAYAHHHNQ